MEIAALKTEIKKWIITGGGLGLLKPAPGSWGSCGPAIIWWLLLWRHAPVFWRIGVCGGVIVAASIFTIALCPWAEAYFGKKDPGQVVLDEYAGFMVATLWIPLPAGVFGNALNAWLMTAAVYVLFRLADTLKMPPCRALEKLPAGWGVLLDDLAAGLQVNIVLQIGLRLWHGG